jgi:hypothetical protein
MRFRRLRHRRRLQDAFDGILKRQIDFQAFRAAFGALRHATSVLLLVEGYSDSDRAGLIVNGAEGKHMTYKQPSGVGQN